MNESEMKAFKSELQTMLKTVRPNVMARVSLADGRYYAQKVTEEVTILRQDAVTKKWDAFKPADIKKGDNIVLLNKAEQFGSGHPVSVAVNEQFSDFPLKSFFSFEVTNNRTKLSLDKLDKKQVEELTK